MRVGDLIDDRFEVERVVATGGMGAVWRAHDRRTSTSVAIKTAICGARDGARFQREAQVLADLDHPAIVRHVAHGVAENGERWLAMEWLEGEDLAARLGRAPMTPAETVVAVSSIAAALAHAHARGVVHRDVKPSNVFLCDRDPARAKVLDFGLARPMVASHAMTATGAVIGTIGYMAPEQAAGAAEVDARADVFSLGCVLFECLTGRPAFSGAHLVAVLAKVLCESPPRLSELRPDLPRALDELVGAMTARRAVDRPADGAEVVRALAGVALEEPCGVAATAPKVPLGAVEQRLVSAMLIEIEPEHAGSALRISPADIAADAALGTIVRAAGGEIVTLATGAVLVTITAASSAGDQAKAAALCALALRDALVAARIALATGRAPGTGTAALGRAIDRAATLLRKSGAASPTVIRVDDATRSLLDAAFEIVDGELIAQRPATEERLLLGTRAPCVGREKELALLEATVNEASADRVARVWIVTAGPGFGKSRLARELVRRVGDDVRVMRASAEPLGAGSALALVRELVRGAGHERSALAARLLELGSSDQDARATSEMLAEILGARSDDEPSPRLRAALNDAVVMNDAMRSSFTTWLAAECAREPLLLILEDLHWADRASLAYVDHALRELAHLPLAIVALARLEVDALAPNLWADAGAQTLRLGGLSPRASERLVKGALGARVADARLAKIVERAGGNALFLEELVRREADGATSELPEGIAAVIEARLSALDADARRVLRAASVLGETFSAEGVRAILVDTTAVEIEASLDALVAREVVAMQRSSHATARGRFAFRHALVRDSAYEMLAADDRARAHALAATWLEAAGEHDAAVLAAHFERGGDLARAAHHHESAAKQAFAAFDVAAVVAHLDRAVACGLKGERRGELEALAANGVAWLARPREVIARARSAMPLLRPGSPSWCLLGWGAFAFLGQVGEREPMRELLATMLSVEPEVDVDGRSAEGYMSGVIALSTGGQQGLANQVAEMFSRACASSIARNAATEAWFTYARAQLAIAESAPYDALVLARAAFERFVACGHRVGEVEVSIQTARLLGYFGQTQEARSLLAQSSATAKSIGSEMFELMSEFHLGDVEAELGAEGACAHLSSVIEEMERAGLDHMVAWGRCVLASAHLGKGEPRRALELLDGAHGSRGKGLRALEMECAARAWMSLGEPARALERAVSASELARQGGVPQLEAIHLVLAEALLVNGRADEAKALFGRARDDLLATAKTIAEPALAASYLARAYPNARILRGA